MYYCCTAAEARTLLLLSSSSREQQILTVAVGTRERASDRLVATETLGGDRCLLCWAAANATLERRISLASTSSALLTLTTLRSACQKIRLNKNGVSL